MDEELKVLGSGRNYAAYNVIARNVLGIVHLAVRDSGAINDWEKTATGWETHRLFLQEGTASLDLRDLFVDAQGYAHILVKKGPSGAYETVYVTNRP